MAAVSRETAAIGRWLFAATLGLYVFTAGGSLTTSDAVGTFEVAASLVERHSVAMSGNVLGRDGQRGVDGRYYAPFGLAQSLYDVPFYLAGRTIPIHVGKSTTMPKAAVAMGQTVVAALLVWQVFSLAVFVTGDARASLGAAVTCAVGSLFWPYSGYGFNEPLAAATLLAAVTDAIVGVRTDNTRRLARAGIWLAVSLMTRHEMALGLVPIALWIAWAGDVATSTRRARLLALAPGVACGIGAWLVYNALRFGNPLESGYLHDPVPGFGGPMIRDLAGLIFSPSASLLLYSPLVIVGAAGLWQLTRRDPALGRLFAGVIAIFIAFYSTLSGWNGGRTYGSRYLFPILPYFGVGWAIWLRHATDRARRWTFAIVTIAGIAVQLPGVVVDYGKVSQAEAIEHGAFGTHEQRWSWRASALVLDTAAARHLIPQNIRYVTGRDPVPAVPLSADDQDRSFSQRFAFSLDFWWLYLFYMGVITRTGVGAVVLAFVAWIVWCATRVRRAVIRAEAHALG